MVKEVARIITSSYIYDITFRIKRMVTDIVQLLKIPEVAEACSSQFSYYRSMLIGATTWCETARELVLSGNKLQRLGTACSSWEKSIRKWNSDKDTILHMVKYLVPETEDTWEYA